MIKVILAHQSGLIRGALATILQQEEDMDVVAEAAHGDVLAHLVARENPDIVILDLELPTSKPLTELCAELASTCQILVVAERRAAANRRMDVAALAPCTGLIATETSPQAFLEGVRDMMRGEIVLDGELARAALSTRANPLTDREREVLQLADEGLTARDIALKLFLSHGTVRNHLSRVLAKTGARTRIEAIRVAQEAGWL